MKKAKLNKKITLNKKKIAILNNKEILEINGGDKVTTEYPICGISGCWGAQSCFPDTGESFCICS